MGANVDGCIKRTPRSCGISIPAECHPYRFDYKTGYIDGKGFTSPGRVYASEADYHATRAAEVAWRAFLQRLNRQYRKPDGITADAIIEARRLLALDDDK